MSKQYSETFMIISKLIFACSNIDYVLWAQFSGLAHFTIRCYETRHYGV